MNIRVGTGDLEFAKGYVEQTNGVRGLGCFILRIQMVLHVKEAEGAAHPVLSVGPGTLSVEDSTARRGFHVGRVHPMKPYRSIQAKAKSDTASLIFDTELDAARLEAIENSRDGEGLTLKYRIWAAIAVGNRTQEFEIAFNHLLSQSDWATVLGQAHVKRLQLIEVPKPDLSANPLLQEAYQRLAEANGALRAGNSLEAVTHCRRMLELVDGAYEDRDEGQMRLLYQNREKLTKAQRLLLLRHALWIVTSPAAHDGPKAAFINWERADAVALVTTMASLLSWFSGAGDAAPAELFPVANDDPTP